MESVLLHLNTSGNNFAMWLLGRYMKGEFPLEAEPWRILRPEPRRVFGVTRIDIAAELVGADPVQPGAEHEQHRIQAFRFDAFDIGTERNGRVELDALCYTRSFSLRSHFYCVLTHIASLWPEAYKELESAFRSYRRGDGGIGCVIRPWSENALAEMAALFQTGESTPAPRPATQSSPDSADAPWLKIPDHGWDRQAVELLWKGYTSAEIGRRIGREAITVENRFSELRALFGAGLIPRRRELRKSESESGEPGN